MAIGATRSDILRLIMSRGLLLTLIGTVIGLGGAAALSRSLSALLFEISPYETVGDIVVAGVVLAVCVVASWTPAWRACHVDPNVALRCE
jgi:putative ABC transport system permease protein